MLALFAPVVTTAAPPAVACVCVCVLICSDKLHQKHLLLLPHNNAFLPISNMQCADVSQLIKADILVRTYFHPFCHLLL